MESKEWRDVWEREAVGLHECFVEAKAENRGLLLSVQLARGCWGHQLRPEAQRVQIWQDA